MAFARPVCRFSFRASLKPLPQNKNKTRAITLTKSERLDYIRKRAASPMPLSRDAAAVLESIREEDKELGGLAPVGEVLAPDRVRLEERHETEDESERNTELISPLMRVACES
jgi:hypothetical protein